MVVNVFEAVVVSLLTSCMVLPGVDAFAWNTTLEDDHLLYSCEGENATFLWDYTTHSGDQIVTVEWLFKGNGSDELIATLINQNFLPSATFSKRVELEGKAGIKLLNAQDTDSGMYTLVIGVVDAGTHAYETLNRTATLHVATASSSSNDVTLQMNGTTQAVYDSVTGRYHIQLQCHSLGQQPPDSVVWTTPTGATYPSSSSEGSIFTFLIPHPVEEGNYSCQVPDNSSAAKCLNPHDPSLFGDEIFVDRTESRLTLLEAETEALHRENTDLKQENAELRADNDNLTAVVKQIEHVLQNLTQGSGLVLPPVHDPAANVTAEYHKLKEENDQLADHVNSLEAELNQTKEIVDRHDGLVAQVTQNATVIGELVLSLSDNLTETSLEMKQDHDGVVTQLDGLKRELQAEERRQREGQENLTGVVSTLQSDLMAEAVNLTQYVDDVKDDLRHEEDSLALLTQNVSETLAAQARHLEQQEANMTMMVQALQSSVTTDNDRLKQQTSRLNESVAHLELSLLQYTTNMTDNTHTLSGMDDRMAEAQTNLTDRMEELENRLSQADSQLSQSMHSLRQNVSAELSQVKYDVTNVTSSAQDVDNLRDELHDARQEVSHRVTELETELSHLTQNDTHLGQHLADLESDLKIVEDRLQNNTSSLAHRLHELEDADQKNQADVLQMMHNLEGNFTQRVHQLGESDANLTDYVHSVEAKVGLKEQNILDNSSRFSQRVQDLESALSQLDHNQTEQRHALEAELASQSSLLQDRTSQLMNDLRDLEHNSTLEKDHFMAVLANITTLLGSLEADVKNVTSHDKGPDQDLMQHVHNLPQQLAAARVGVSFHAMLTEYEELNNGDTIIPTNVTLNQGKGYNSTTGVFTAPYDGTYFFIATTAPYKDRVNMNMVVEGVVVAITSLQYGDFYDMGTCHSVVHLSQGQRVWLRNFDTGHYAPQFTVFSGFLISADMSP